MFVELFVGRMVFLLMFIWYIIFIVVVGVFKESIVLGWEIDNVEVGIMLFGMEEILIVLMNVYEVGDGENWIIKELVEMFKEYFWKMSGCVLVEYMDGWKVFRSLNWLVVMEKVEVLGVKVVKMNGKK